VSSVTLSKSKDDHYFVLKNNSSKLYSLFFAILANKRSLALNFVPLLASDTCADASSSAGTGVPLVDWPRESGGTVNGDTIVGVNALP
jgi:hypothetical protein